MYIFKKAELSESDKVHPPKNTQTIHAEGEKEDDTDEHTN